MKKYTVLFSLTFAFLLFSLFFNESHDASLPIVDTVIAEEKSVNDTVIAQGSFADKNAVNLSYGIPLKINQIFVEEGDYVKAGEPLFSIDREKTVNYLLSSGASGAVKNGFDYQIITSLPEKVVASASGYVTNVNYLSGGIYDTLNPIISISEKENIIAVVSVSESVISKVKTGQKVSLECLGTDKKRLNGTVSKIGNSAKSVYTNGTTENAVDVEIKLINSNTAPKLGYSLTATIKLNSHKAVVLPYSCISQDKKGEYVYVITDGLWAKKRYIKTKNDYRTGSEVEENLGGAILVSNPKILKGNKIKLVTK